MLPEMERRIAAVQAVPLPWLVAEMSGEDVGYWQLML